MQDAFNVTWLSRGGSLHQNYVNQSRVFASSTHTSSYHHFQHLFVLALLPQIFRGENYQSYPSCAKHSFSNTVDSTTFTPVAKWAHNQLERQFPSSVPWHIGGLRVRFDSTWCGSVGEGDDAVTLLSLIYIQLVSSLYVPFPSKIQLSNQRGFSLYLGRFYSGKNQLHSVYLRRSKNDFHDIIGAFFFVPRLLFKKYRCIFIYANRAA